MKLIRKQIRENEEKIDKTLENLDHKVKQHPTMTDEAVDDITLAQIQSLKAMQAQGKLLSEALDKRKKKAASALDENELSSYATCFWVLTATANIAFSLLESNETARSISIAFNVSMLFFAAYQYNNVSMTALNRMGFFSNHYDNNAHAINELPHQESEQFVEQALSS